MRRASLHFSPGLIRALSAGQRADGDWGSVEADVRGCKRIVRPNANCAGMTHTACAIGRGWRRCLNLAGRAA